MAFKKEQPTWKETNNHEKEPADLYPYDFITEMLKLISGGLTNMNKSITKRNWTKKIEKCL